MALSIIACTWRSTGRLQYFINQSGNANPESLTIPNAAGASPDLRTDALLGVQFGPPPIGGISLFTLLNARATGYAQIPAGPLTQDQARALLMGMDQSKLTLTNPLIQYAQVRLIGSQNTDALAWGVAADIDGSGNPVIIVESNAFGSGNNRGQCFVEIELRPTLLG